MISTSLPRMLGWGNLHRPCQASLDRLRPRGEVCQLAWSSPVFPRRIQHEVPDKTRFLVRPRLLKRSVPLPRGGTSPHSTSATSPILTCHLYLWKEAAPMLQQPRDQWRVFNSWSLLILQRHLQNIRFYHKGLRVCKKSLSFVAGDRKAAILRVQIWSAHESDVVGVVQEYIPHSRRPSWNATGGRGWLVGKGL
jgi:hypothetical protein